MGLERGKPTKLFTDGLKHSLVHDKFFEKLRQIIQQDLEVLCRTEQSNTDYNDPSWAYRQAHRNGQVASLNKIMTLISFKEDH
jgi:hypothetical protein